MSELPTPREGALAGVEQFEAFDAFQRIRIPYENGFILFFPDSATVHIRPDLATSAYTTYNFRTDRGWYEGGNTREGYLPRIVAALPDLARGGVDTQAIPEGYPEIDRLFSENVQEHRRIEMEQLGKAEHCDTWYIARTIEQPPIGVIKSYHLFKLDSVTEATNGLGEDCYAIRAHDLGFRLEDNEQARGISIGADRAGRTYYNPTINEGLEWSFMGGVHLVQKDPCKRKQISDINDLAFFPFDEVGASEILKLLRPSIDPMEGIRFGRESATLKAALNGLQYARWSKWDGFELNQLLEAGEAEFVSKQQARLDAMNYEAYEASIMTLIDRFGGPFFTEVAWQTITRHLNGLHSQEIMPSSPYKAHADVSPYGRSWMATAKHITRASHPLPEDMSASGMIVNVLPLYGDVDFWNVLEQHHPNIYTELSQRFLAIPDDSKQRGTYADAIVHPRALLRDHFPEVYDLLRRKNSAFIAPLGSIAVQRIGATDV